MSSQYTESVTLYSGVPFDNTYQYTLNPYPISTKLKWFAQQFPDAFKQSNIMHIKLSTVTGMGIIRLEVPNSKIATFNYAYIAHKDSQYFAFVLGYTYINDGQKAGSSIYELTIQKDVIMSHLVDTNQLHDASIIRHHSTNRFKNPWVAEPFQGGQVQNHDFDQVPVETCKSYAVIQYITTSDESMVSDCAEIISRIPSGTLFAFCKWADRLAISNFIKDNAKKAGNIAAIYTAPECLFNAAPANGGSDLKDNYVNTDPIIVYPELRYADMIDVPLRNNKCYYYPYNFFRVYNDSGQYMDLRYELWKGAEGLGKVLSIEGNVLAPVSVTIAPVGYMNASGSQHGDGFGLHYDYPSTHKLTLSGYPMGSWVNDTYSQAVGSGRVFDAQALFSGDTDQILNTFTRYGVNHVKAPQLSGSLEADALAGATSLMSIDMAAEAASYQADTLSGTPGCGNTEYSNLHKYFYTSHMALSTADATALDSIFDKFGYAQGGVIAKPDPFGRPLWCYIQTGSDTFFPTTGDGACNTTEAARINSIFRNGVTFWNGNVAKGDIGNFTADNGNDTIPKP